MKSRLVLFALFTTSMVLVLFAATLAQSQGSVGTVSYVQENGRRVEGLVSVDGYSVTVTLKDPSGAIKSTRTTWPSSGLRYIVNLTATIRPSDTLEVAAGGVTTLIFVDPLSAQLDPDHDQVTGLGPAGEAVALDLKLYDEWGMAETYTGTAHVDANGSFTASSFYLDGVGPQAVDIQPGDNGTLRYTHADGNQVTLNFGQIIYVHQDTNQVHGYAALHSVPVSVILYAPGGSVKAEASTTSSSLGAGSYSVYLYTPGWPRQPVPVRGGDTVVVDIEGVTTTVAVDLLTATPDLSSDTVSGFGPPNSSLKLTLHGCHDGWSDELDCPQWVTTDGAGDYSAGPFLYHTREISGGSSVWVTRTCDIVAGTTGQVNYISPDFNVNSISYGAPQVKVQENARRVEGVVAVNGYSVTVTLKDPSGAVKSTRTTWSSTGLRYLVNLTATIRPSDTVEVSSGGATTLVFVEPLAARLDPDNDRVTGLGPANEAVPIELRTYDEVGMASTYTSTANVDAHGLFTVSTFYRYGSGPQAVDIQPGDNGTLRYTNADGNQVTLNFGQIVYIHQNDNRVHGYAGMNNVPITVTLYAPDGSMKAEANTISSAWGSGSYSVELYTAGQPQESVPIRGGDTVVVDVEGVTTSVAVDLLTATPDLSSDTVSGFGPPNSTLKLTLEGCWEDALDESDCPQQVTTDGTGAYAGQVFTYVDEDPWSTVTYTHDIIAGDTGQVHYITSDFNVIYIDYAAPQTRVQEDGWRVDGVVAVDGYSVTVTLQDSLGAVKSMRTTWPDASLCYQVDLTATIRPSDTVHVSSGGATTLVFVEPLAARLDPDNDRVTGLGPTGEAVALELNQWGTYRTYTSTANVDAAGSFTASSFYLDGSGPHAVDIQPGDNGTLRYTNADGNQVTLNFGQIVYIHQNDNRVHGYAGMNNVPITVTLYAPDGSMKAKGGTTSSSEGAGSYSVDLFTEVHPYKPVPIRGGDTVVIIVAGTTTSVTVDLLTATPDLGLDTIAGSGPPSSTLKLTLNGCYDLLTGSGCPIWVTTDGAGDYSAGSFLHHTRQWITGTGWVWFTQTHNLVVGDAGQLYYISPNAAAIYINYAATGVATTIAAGGLRAEAMAVLGTAVPGATVEIWDTTQNALIGTSTAGASGRFAVTVSPTLVYGHAIVAIAENLPSIEHVVQRAVTIKSPPVSISTSVGLYGIAPASSPVEVYASGVATAVAAANANPAGRWSATAHLANGTYTLTALSGSQVSDPIVVVVDTTAVAIGGSLGTVGETIYGSNPSGENHFQVVGSVQPITVSVPVFNNPCTVTISFMGQTITPDIVISTLPMPVVTYTVVFTDYDWQWGTHEVVVGAESCRGDEVSQPVAEVTLIDPSGYVYDAVTGDKIEAATVTCYYSDTKKGRWVIWEAARYSDQLNPQVADEEGGYGFMVPAGYYYVAASKPGYLDNHTIVYGIPPEVTDAHIPLTPMLTQSIDGPGRYIFGGTGLHLDLMAGQIGSLSRVSVTLSRTYPTASHTGLPRRYEVSGEGAGFTATLSVCYDPAELLSVTPPILDETRLQLYRYTGSDGVWQAYTSTVDRDTHCVSATVTEFSTWAIGAPNNAPTAITLRSARTVQGTWAWFALVAGVTLFCAGTWRRKR